MARIPEATLDAVDRRRSQLSVLLLVVLVGLCAVTVAVPAGIAAPVSSNVLRVGIIGLSATFAAYALEKERALRRLERALREEQETAARAAEMREQMARLIRAGEAVATTLDPKGVAQVGLDGALHLLGSEDGVLFFERGDLIPEAQRGDLRFDQDDARRVRDANLDEVTVSHSHGEVALFTVPLRHEGRSLGVLAVAGSLLTADSDADLLGAYARQLSIALANARMYRAARVVNERFGRLEDVQREFDWLADLDVPPVSGS